MDDRSITLVGFSGAGKTTVARIVAKRLGWAVVDSDAIVETTAGKSIAEIFASSGEAAFRALEADVCRRAATQTRTVIATGGGALIDSTTCQQMNESTRVVCLNVTADEAWSRLSDDDARPLIAGDDGRGQMQALYEARADFYAGFSTRIDVTGRTPEAIASEIIAALEAAPDRRRTSVQRAPKIEEMDS